MNQFLWKIGGGDYDILIRSGKDSQSTFKIIGVVFLITSICSYLAFFSMFWGLFRGVIKDESGVPISSAFPLLTAILGGLVLGFLISSIYRLNIISLEPNSLPVKKENNPMFLTNFIRFSTIMLFAFFVSKNLEMMFVNFLQSAGFFEYDKSTGYINQMMLINTSKPFVWLFTVAFMVLFLSPVFLRRRLVRAHEYYLYKRIRDKSLVERNYAEYLSLRKEIIRKGYEKYRVLLDDYYGDEPSNPSLDNHPVNERTRVFNYLSNSKYSHKPLFWDEPFNTKPIRNSENFGSLDDFLFELKKQK
jgi:hypothetical protein